MYWANVAYLLMVAGSAAVLLSCACARAGCCAQLFWRDRGANTALRPAQRLVADIEAGAGAQRPPPTTAPSKHPVPQAVIDTFPTELYRPPAPRAAVATAATPPPATAAVHRSVDTTHAPDQHVASGPAGNAATIVLIGAGGKSVEAPKAQPLEPVLAGQGSGCSAGGGPLAGGQADGGSAPGGLGRADSTGGGTALGTALRRMSRAFSGGPPDDLAASLCSVSRHTCTICLGEYEGGEELRRLPCLHSFHRPCIDAWMASTNTCPICRLDLTN